MFGFITGGPTDELHPLTKTIDSTALTGMSSYNVNSSIYIYRRLKNGVEMQIPGRAVRESRDKILSGDNSNEV